MAAEKEELRPEKPDAISPEFDHGFDFLGHLDIGFEQDTLPVLRGGGKIPYAFKGVFPQEPELVGRPFLPQRILIRIKDDDAPVPVDDEGGSGLHIREEAPYAEDGGNLESAREDGGMACPSPRLGDDSLDPSPDHGDHVRGKEFPGDQDDIHVDIGEVHALTVQEVAQDPADNVVYVRYPFLHIGVLGGGKLVDHFPFEGEDDAFDVQEQALQPEPDALHHLRVVEHHEVGAEDGGLFLARHAARLVAQVSYIDLCLFDRLEKAAVLGGDLLAGYRVGGNG